MVAETILRAQRQPTILIAENDPDRMEILNEHFRQKGNKVIPALSVEATEAVLKYSRNDLDAAIVDVRLTDDNDPSDESGLSLAEKVSEEPGVDFPIFIHSRFRNRRISRESVHGSQRPNLIEVPKSEGIAALSKSVSEEIQKKKKERQERVSGELIKHVVATPGSIWSKQHKALVALISLVITLISGIGAVVFGEPKLLLMVVAGAITAVVFVGWMLD